ncbi:opsin-1, short-wave-sensitive 1-like [Clytia hemisphaerica]|uniref:opsin-1, short-wave-sensitive 1-like n=1 Tax=Clytia hemisphaerica TaxID=252671 RepID=UPI0034D5C6D4
MGALAIERYLSISKPFISIKISQSKFYAILFIVASWVYGSMWALFPWFGWGRYAYESLTNHRCSIDLVSRSPNIVSYNYTLLVFCYIVPIIIMMTSFCIIKREIAGMLQKVKDSTGKNSKSATATVKQERTFTVVVAVMLTSFLLAWTPYALCVFLVSLRIEISPDFLDVSAYLGKSSIIHNPIIYVFLYKQFRTGLLRLFLACFRIPPNSVVPESSFVGSQTEQNNRTSKTGL